MKPILPAGALALTALLASASLAAAAPKVVASIKPVHSLVAAVMKGIGEPGLIVEGAGSPHGYNLKPSQAGMIQDADLIFWVGPELETFLAKPIETIGAGTRAVELLEAPGVAVLAPREGGSFETHDHEAEGEDHAHEGEAGHAAEEGHDDHEVDPHVWLDPDNAKAFVAAIADALAAADPDNAAAYAANAAAENARIDATVGEVAALLAPVKGKGFIVFHDAYHYFENRFGIEASGSITINPELAPGAERLSEIQNKLRELGAACVFSEPQFQSSVVSVVTEGTAARSGVLDPLGTGLPDGPDLYPALLKNLGTAIHDCLAAAG